jgi:hypothetical protein
MILNSHLNTKVKGEETAMGMKKNLQTKDLKTKDKTKK